MDSAVVVVRLEPGDLVLLLQRTDAGSDASLHGRWGFPGGKVDCSAGESYAEAAVRELREETGLDWSSGSEPPVLDFPPYRVAVFEWVVGSEEQLVLVSRLRLNPAEHTQAGWFTAEDALRLELAGPGTRYILERLL